MKGMFHMKQSKICPKCGSSDILQVEDSGGPMSTDNLLKISWMEYASFSRYVCCKCGYIEEWLDTSDLQNLQKKLEKKGNK